MTFIKNNLTKINFYSDSLFTFVLFSLISAVLTQNILFWFNVSVNTIALIVPFVLWIFVDKYLYGSKDQIKRVITNYLVYIGIIIIFIKYYSMFIEFSYDGNFYHGDTMIQLVYGWNPITLAHQYLNTNGNVWAELYPKFTWIIGAFFIQLTSMSSSGMILNGIIGFITLIKVYAYMKVKTSKIFALFIALIVVFNPIFIEQMHTLYVDGIIAHLVVLLIISNLELMENYNNHSVIHMVMITIILMNIKFTSFAFAGLIDLSSFVFFLIKDRKIAIKIFLAGVIILVIGLFIGYSPYIVNLIEKRNIFWPLAGKNNWITGDDQLLPQMYDLTSLERFFYSLTYGEYLRGLINFESKGYLFYDQRIGAMGINFAKYLVLTGPLMFLYLIKDRKKLNLSYILLFFFFTISIIFNYPMVWKLRYIPHFWLMVPMTIILARYLFKTQLLSILLVLLFFHQTVDMIKNNYEHNFWATNLYRDIYSLYDDGYAYNIRVGESDRFIVMEEYKLKEYGVNINQISYETYPDETCHRVDMYTICFAK
jgi:hypothetical protein